jgi:hypothetical protein
MAGCVCAFADAPEMLRAARVENSQAVPRVLLNKAKRRI